MTTVAHVPLPIAYYASGMRLRDALAATKTQPLDKVPHGFILACVIELISDSEYRETLLLSFAKYPVSVCLNGQCFKSSAELLLLVSEFLPSEAAESWRRMESSLRG